MLQPRLRGRSSKPDGMSPLRVGLVCPYSLDIPGGVQNHVRDLAAVLVARGHQVQVLAPGEPSSELPGYVTTVGRAVPVRFNGSVARVAFGPRAVSGVRRWLADGDFDVLHVHEPSSPSVSLLALWASDVPVVGTFHSAMGRSRAMSSTVSLLRPAMEKISARIAVSEAARATLVQHVGGEPVVIPNGLWCATFADALPRPEWTTPGPTIAFLGRLDETRKGLAVLMEAFPLVLDRHPTARLLVAGGGDAAAWADAAGGCRGPRRASSGAVSDDDKASLLVVGDDLRRAADRWRELRHRARRGDGGGRHGRGQRAARIPGGPRRWRPGRPLRDRRPVDLARVVNALLDDPCPSYGVECPGVPGRDPLRLERPVSRHRSGLRRRRRRAAGRGRLMDGLAVWLAVVVVLLVVAVLVCGAWFSWTAGRLDRMHLRLEAAQASLVPSSSIGRRWRASSRAVASPTRPRPCCCSRPPGTPGRAPGQWAERWLAESDLTATLFAVDLPSPDHEPLMAELTDVARKAGMARRIHNDVASTTQRLHNRRRVRWFHLAGHATPPRMIDFDDRPDFAPG